MMTAYDYRYPYTNATFSFDLSERNHKQPFH